MERALRPQPPPRWQRSPDCRARVDQPYKRGTCQSGPDDGTHVQKNFSSYIGYNGEGPGVKRIFILQVGLQGLAERRTPGLVNFVTALACHFCLALPAAITQPGHHLLAEPCSSILYSYVIIAIRDDCCDWI